MSIEQWLAKPKRKRLNAEERKQLKATALQLYVRQSGRQAQKGQEPNDRQFSREVEQTAKRMKADEFYRLAIGGEDE